MKDIYYLVRLKDDIQDEMYYKSTIKNKFCGKIVHQENGKIFFELNNSDALVIIPYDWILWLAPSKVLWDKQIAEKNKSKTTGTIVDLENGILYCPIYPTGIQII